MLPSPLIPTFLTLLHLTHALPTTISPPPERRPPSLESWPIPRLDMHMMSIHTGLPGDDWGNSTFPSTISFDVLVPPHSSNSTTIKSTCTASFPNHTLPLGRTYCTPPSPAEVLFFELYAYTGLGPRRPELAFWLDLTSAVGWDEENRSAEMFWWGSRAVTANNPAEESSFLTCVEGAPLDGLRCEIGSYLSVREELVVRVEKIGADAEDDGDGEGEGRS
ncbi:hypothetical protein BDU57DRAFT_517433 [Ampelomyces quisqualis]|uniref:Ubiquitin 3 binding protein But2 C-terminal domain-containing protein n=1 Tax=Ampelomyces quisqualis TaxID=50730 RepID=A0A6A5QQA0_AMPQU|nr:hypothetical protein BDU57DRAFT_517433 [Ampelomyces quisqualis]